MSNYTKLVNFSAKDALPSGDAAKLVKGTEIDTEFTNIQTAVNTKADTASPALTGTPTAPTAASGTNTTQIATTAFVAAAAEGDKTYDTDEKIIFTPVGDTTPRACLSAYGFEVSDVELATLVGTTSNIQNQIDSKLDDTVVSQAVAEAGTSTDAVAFTPERVKQAIDALSNFYPTYTPVSKAEGTWHNPTTDVVVRIACATTGYYSVYVGSSTSVYNVFGYKGNGSNGSQASAAIPVAAGQYYKVVNTFSTSPTILETRI